ncbi:21093_t:CDS:2 [Entrophospora sp. SA101]|nr:6297_t:CDS:2 [Entrophospora sp. SA101]CAJ0745239.1 21093_t:CDS:2 [Entrophospora sp. SA101]CAJ0898760.1 9932_t:CDS:2 [Entrophospora sp. SA101]CAJ0918428.1 5031_t:CDS:2 [Entrophospora sp. SA101]
MATATPQITGESVQTTLEVLDKVGIKDNIEEAIQTVDKDTPEQREEEEKRITRRIYRVELLLNFLMYYTSLIIQWLTLLGLSSSFGNFLYNVLIGSFVFTEWNFGDISTVGKISGVTISLQIILFIISNIIVLFYRRFHPSKQSPARLQGPIYYNGILKGFNLLKPKVESYNTSVKKLDAQFSQILGAISQVLIIIAASFSASSNITSLNGISDSGIDTAFPTGLGGFIQIENNQVEEESIAVKHAAGFAKTTLLVAVLAIIMTSIMNVISWMIGIWKVNNDELIVYAIFKFITRMITCYPCFHDKLVGADKKIDDKTNESEMEALEEMGTQKKPPLELGKKNTLTSPNVQTLIDNTISEGASGKENTIDDLNSIVTTVSGTSNNNDEKSSNIDASKVASDGVKVASSVIEGQKQSGSTDTKPVINEIVSDGIKTIATDTGGGGDIGKTASEGIKAATSVIEGQKQSGSTDTKPSDVVDKLVSSGIQVIGNIIDGGSDTKLDANKIASDGVKIATSAIEGQKDSDSTKKS